ncbi:restriction endonuclease [bacterium]|nr:restriction endonuclease [bacterium]
MDLLIRKNDSRYIVQCKQRRAFKVGVQVVREMFGVMTADHADGVVIVTSGMFTQEALNFANGKPIDLVDGPQLLELVRNVQTKPQTQPGRRPVPTASQPAPKSPRKCPRCGSELTIREARRGPNTGEKFWGCSAFPSCRYTEKVISHNS